jgi:hypothetical protein
MARSWSPRVFCKIRTIIESDRFEREKAEIEPDAAKLDGALEGVTIAVARQPDQVGKSTASRHVWAVTTHALLGVPALIVYYLFDENSVTLLSVRLAGSSSDDAIVEAEASASDETGAF